MRDIGNDEIQSFRDKGFYCAEVVRAKEMRSDLITYIPNDAPGTCYTANGHDEIIGHENRRVDICRLAWAGIMSPSELEGALTKKCNILCACNPDETEEALAAYLEALRTKAKQTYQTWIIDENFKLTLMELPVGTDGKLISPTNPLTDGYQAIFVPKPPPDFHGPPCPTVVCLRFVGAKRNATALVIDNEIQIILHPNCLLRSDPALIATKPTHWR